MTAPAAQAEALSALFEDEALAVTVMNPPRHADCRVEAIFGEKPDAEEWRAKLRAVVAAARPDLTVEPVPQEDWLKKVAMENPPRAIGRLVIHGRHDAGKIPHHVPSLEIEAATAFGTGEHPSTQMCLLLIQDYLRRKRPRRALDLGCGSGILALALARLAHCKVLAVDNDAESVRMTRHNARVNGLENYVETVHGAGYGARAVGARAPYDLIVANIFARPLMLLAADLRQHLAPGGVAILSGLLQSQAVMVQSAHAMKRLHLVKTIHCGEWSALMLIKRQMSDVKRRKT